MSDAPARRRRRLLALAISFMAGCIVTFGVIVGLAFAFFYETAYYVETSWQVTVFNKSSDTLDVIVGGLPEEPESTSPSQPLVGRVWVYTLPPGQELAVSGVGFRGDRFDGAFLEFLAYTPGEMIAPGSPIYRDSRHVDGLQIVAGTWICEITDADSGHLRVTYSQDSD